MTSKRFKWATHLEVAEGSGLSLVAYAQKHRIDVHRLYEARQLRKCRRRLNIDPPCRSNIDPGRVADS